MCNVYSFTLIQSLMKLHLDDQYICFQCFRFRFLSLYLVSLLYFPLQFLNRAFIYLRSTEPLFIYLFMFNLSNYRWFVQYNVTRQYNNKLNNINKNTKLSAYI